MDNVLVSATGYTGAGGVEIYFEDADGWQCRYHMEWVFEAGKAAVHQTHWPGARDTLGWRWAIAYGMTYRRPHIALEAGLDGSPVQ